MIDKVYGINIALLFDVSSVLNIVFFVLNIVWCIFCIKYCFVVSWWCIFCQETAVIVSPPRPVPPTHCHQKCHTSQYHLAKVPPSTKSTTYQKYLVPPTHCHQKCHTIWYYLAKLPPSIKVPPIKNIQYHQHFFIKNVIQAQTRSRAPEF